MNRVKSVVCASIVAMSMLSGGLFATESSQNGGASDSAAVTGVSAATKPASNANSNIGARMPGQRLNPDGLEAGLAECVWTMKNAPGQFASLTDCLSYIDPFEP